MTMAKLKTKPTSNSVPNYIAIQKDERRRRDCTLIVEMMKHVSKMEPTLWGTSIVGFGKYHYKYESGHEGDTFFIGFSSRKDSIVIYLSGGVEAAKDLLKDLGKYKTGKGCLYIKTVDDINQAQLEKVFKNAIAFQKERSQ
jgi:hypothetical protein